MLASLGLDAEHIWNTFQRDGTVNIPIFVDMIDDPDYHRFWLEEFAEGLWHQRERDGVPNRGWKRVTVYAVMQEKAGGDPVQYAVYNALRPDRAYRLISYPYYCKSTVPGDKTGFRHIDLNPTQAVQNGIGVNMIQGSLALSDEDEYNCTVLVKGMQKTENIQAWVEYLKDSRRGTKGPIANVNDCNLPKQLLEKLDLSWEGVPCKAGEIRVSHPLLPHGSTSPATSYRLNLLSWLTAVESNGMDLEVKGVGTWEQIRDARLTHTAPPATPSDYKNKFGPLPWCHEPVKLADSWEVGKAISCGAPYQDMDVMQDVKLMLSGDAARVRPWLVDFRKAEKINVIRPFKRKVENEIERFGPRSFYRKLQTFRQSVDLSNAKTLASYMPVVSAAPRADDCDPTGIIASADENKDDKEEDDEEEDDEEEDSEKDDEEEEDDDADGDEEEEDDDEEEEDEEESEDSSEEEDEEESSSDDSDSREANEYHIFF